LLSHRTEVVFHNYQQKYKKKCNLRPFTFTKKKACSDRQAEGWFEQHYQLRQQERKYYQEA